MIWTKDPARVVTATFGDKTFQAGQATYGNLLDTRARLAKIHPGAYLHVIQPCYNTDVEASAGTHDKDAVLDVRIYGVEWTTAQMFLRRCGWAAWWRHTGSWADPADWHLHMVSLGAFRAMVPVGIYVPGQVDDYRRHALGLAGQHDSGDDPTWHPRDIDATVFSYRKWRRNHFALARR